MTPGRTGESKKQFVDKLAADLAKDLPGYSIGISQPIIDGVNDLIGGAHSPLVIKIYGDDLDELRGIGGESWTCSTRSPAPPAHRIFQEPPIPQIEIKLDREKAARYGVNMTDVQNVIQTGVGQAPVSTVYVGERTYPLTVRFTEDARNSPDALGNLLVNTASGVQVPLSQLADIRVRIGREHRHARERPAQSHHPHRQPRPRSDLVSEGSADQDRLRRSISIRTRSGSNGAGSSRTSGAPKRGCW